MISKVYFSLTLYGTHFSPRELAQLADVSFDEVIEKGVTQMTTGRYKHQIAPYGSASIRAEVGAGHDYNRILHTLLSTFHQKTQTYLPQCRIEKTILWVTINFDTDGQYGFEIDSDNLLLMGEIGATLAVNIGL